MLGVVALEDGQRGGDGDVVLNEQRWMSCFGLGCVGRHLREGGSAGAAGADVGLLAGVELRVHEEAVLEVVDAELGGFGIGDGAEVTGDFEAAFVSFVDGGLELGAKVMFM